jgi:hypothetical protein
MKNKLLLLISVLTFIILPGCLDNKPKMNPIGPVIRSSEIPIDIVPSPGQAATKDDLVNALTATAAGIMKQSSDSQNAIQTNMQSVLGVSVGKITDDLIKVQAQFKNLAEVNAALNASLNASVASGNDIKLMLKAQMDFNADLVASLKVNADLSAKMEALGGAQAGFNNKIDQQTSEMKQKIEAGRDVNSVNTQFTKEMLETIKSLNQTNIDTSKQWSYVLAGLISSIAGIVSLYLHKQKTKAEDREKVANDRSFDMQSKAIGYILPGNKVNS